MIPGSSTIISFNFNPTGYPGPVGGLYPLPGIVGITGPTTPCPPTTLGQGGGIRIADTPIGFSFQDLVLTLPSTLIATLALRVIIAEATVGLRANSALKSKLVNSNSIVFDPLVEILKL